jgi:hypothetical protein
VWPRHATVAYAKRLSSKRLARLYVAVVCLRRAERLTILYLLDHWCHGTCSCHFSFYPSIVSRSQVRRRRRTRLDREWDDVRRLFVTYLRLKTEQKLTSVPWDALTIVLRSLGHLFSLWSTAVTVKSGKSLGEYAY